jgi:hypothetical protein
METAPLKSFATWARAALIRETNARVAVVLGAASPERIEQPGAVAALEKAVAGAGGGEKGRTAVADRVAYTWFNRIIALRFMDANGYTGVGVVSPQAGIENGQPEILADAKRGTIDTTVVGTETSKAVADLLNGTRRSNDPQGEAYALLLAEYCRHWNRTMPFMFERQGDYTELLIPADLLADDSVLSRAVRVLTPQVCEDVEVIGWLYQFYISERKDEVFAGFKKNKKAGAAEIPAATQLFTPHWIVRYLVENSVGRLWMLNHPQSRLIDQMEYYVAPVDKETDVLEISSPEELTVIDPACGSGHMLTYAFDLLYAIYEEEGYARSEIPALILTHNLYGTEIDPRAGALAAFALTMKACARHRRFFSKEIEPNICVLEPIKFTPQELDLLVTSIGIREDEAEVWNLFEHADIFGSLIHADSEKLDLLRAHVNSLVDDGSLFAGDAFGMARVVLGQAGYLTRKYSAVVANPPYMGSGNMGSTLSGFAKSRYPVSKFDLMAMFIDRAASIVQGGGALAMITLSSWMFNQDAAAFRKSLLGRASISSLLHLGRGIFGVDYGTVAFSATLGHNGRSSGVYRKLYDVFSIVRTPDEIRELFLDRSHSSYIVKQQAIESLPGGVFAYWVDSEVADAFRRCGPIGKRYASGNGITTSDNDRFLRYWWEVSAASVRSIGTGDLSGKYWVPINKGGPYRKWSGNREYVLDWRDSGKELFELRPTATMRNVDKFFRPSISWSDVSIGSVVGRVYGAEYAFDASANSVFPEAEREGYAILSLLNSRAIAEISLLLNPGTHFKIGNFEALPAMFRSDSDLGSEISELVAISDMDLSTHELDRTFARDQLVGLRESISTSIARVRAGWTRNVARMSALEGKNNEVIASRGSLPSRMGSAPEAEDVTLRNNPDFEFRKYDRSVRMKLDIRARVDDLVSYAVGCMFGRYSLDETGLILADQGAALRDFLAKVPAPTFVPDGDNVIPIVDGDWFEDDIVARFREFLRMAFGEEHFEENLRFVTESLGVNDLRSYFLKSFYDDHVKRYKKRPIYWLFSSPKESFNALIYLHRYTPSTVSTVLNEYLREYAAKLTASLQQQERLVADGGTPRQVAAAQKEADRLRKVLVELEEYEHNVLYPLASRQLAIHLDDGVKANYPKFGAALKKIPGLEATDE